MSYFLIGVSILVASLYYVYKKMRAAAYQPGMIYKQAQQDPLLGFESEEEVVAGPDLRGNSDSEIQTFWKMPKSMDLFFFPPSQQTSEATSRRRPILALHGGPSIAPTEPWKMGEGIQDFYLYHARGTGYSTRPFDIFPSKGMWPGIKLLEESLGVGAQILDVERLRRKLLATKATSGSAPFETSQKLDLVGHSFGGFIAAMYAAEFPENVRSLTLLVPATVLALPTSNPKHDFMQTIGNMLKEEGKVKEAAEYERFLKERYLNFSDLPQQTDQSLAKRQADFALHYHRATEKKEGRSALPRANPNMIGGMACYASFLSLGMEHNYRSVCMRRLAGSTFPVTIVHGGDDLMPPSVSQEYVSLFARNGIHKDRVEFHVLDGSGHFLYDDPRVLEILRNTMKRADSQE